MRAPLSILLLVGLLLMRSAFAQQPAPPTAPTRATRPIAPGPAQAAPAPQGAAAATAANLPPIETYAEVLTRPLFASDRRKHETVAIPGVAGPVLLRGIVISDDERYALIDEGGPVSRRVKEGETVSAGLVQQILVDRIVLRTTDGALATVKLFDPAAAPAHPSGPSRVAPRPPSQAGRNPAESLAAAGALPQPRLP